MLQPADETQGLDGDEEARQALLDFGVKLDDALTTPNQTTDRTPPLELWAWHLNAFKVFEGMSTQWRTMVGMAGVHYIGLDMTSLPVVEGRVGLRRPLSPGEFNQLRDMELAGKRYLNAG